MFLIIFFLNWFNFQKFLLNKYGIDYEYKKRYCLNNGIDLDADYVLRVCKNKLVTKKEYDNLSIFYKNVYCQYIILKHYICYCPMDFKGFRCQQFVFIDYSFKIKVQKEKKCSVISKPIDKYTEQLCNYPNSQNNYIVNWFATVFFPDKSYYEGLKYKNKYVDIINIKIRPLHFNYYNIDNWLYTTHPLNLQFYLYVVDIYTLQPLKKLVEISKVKNIDNYDLKYIINKSKIEKLFKNGRVYIKPYYKFNKTFLSYNSIDFLENDNYSVTYESKSITNISYSKIIIVWVIVAIILYTLYENLKNY